MRLADHPRQFERLVEWQEGGKGRQAAINIRTAEGFGMLFGIERYKQKNVLGTIQGLLERGVHITVGGKPFAEVRDMFQRKP